MKTIDEQIANAHKRLGKETPDSYCISYSQWAHKSIRPDDPIRPGEWTVCVSGLDKMRYEHECQLFRGPKLAPILKQAVALCRKEFK